MYDIEQYKHTGRLEPNVRLLENAIRANYILDNDNEEAEVIEAVKANEGSKSAPQMILVLFGHRMGYTDMEIQARFGISDKMISALWTRIRAALYEQDRDFLVKVKLIENYLRLMK